MENTEKLTFTCIGTEMEAAFYLDRYANNDRTYLGLYTIDPDIGSFEPFCDISVNIEGTRNLAEDEMFVDVPNFYGLDVLGWMEKNGFVAEHLNEVGFSGFCSYPLVKVNLPEIRKHLLNGSEM